MTDNVIEIENKNIYVLVRYWDPRQKHNRSGRNHGLLFL